MKKMVLVLLLNLVEIRYCRDSIQWSPKIFEREYITKVDMQNDIKSEHELFNEKDGDKEAVDKNVEKTDTYVRVAPLVARISVKDVMKQVLKLQQKLEEKNSRKHLHTNSKDVEVNLDKVKRDTDSQEMHMMLGTFQAILRPMKPENTLSDSEKQSHNGTKTA